MLVSAKRGAGQSPARDVVPSTTPTSIFTREPAPAKGTLTFWVTTGATRCQSAPSRPDNRSENSTSSNLRTMCQTTRDTFRERP